MRNAWIVVGSVAVLLVACRAAEPAKPQAKEPPPRRYLLERVDDVGVVQLYADGFERLAVDQKVLAWHLYQAALAGRDIYVQQKCAEGVAIRDLMEEILTHGSGVDPIELEYVRRYAKLFWINGSPYDAMTSRKNVIGGNPDELAIAAELAERNGARLRKQPGESAGGLVRRLAPMLFDPDHKPMATVKTAEPGVDLHQDCAVTFYGPGVTTADFEGLAEQYELNSNVVEDAEGRLAEVPWRMGDRARGIPPGLYATEIARIVAHLEDAMSYAPEATRTALEALIRFYRSGSREDRIAYDVAWLADRDSAIDTVNGFVEVYLDPRGKKGAWEGIVSYEDPKKAALIKGLAANAQWFEDHMPYDARFRKPDVVGISARSIDVIVETGDAGPVSAIGINLPNDSTVREVHGSKSVSLANVIEASTHATPPKARAEFCFDAAEAKRAERWQALTSDLLVNMHEVIGHASGRQAPDKPGNPADWIGETYSPLEEARSDLVALWFMMDPKLAELGLLEDPVEGALAAYEQYVRNGGLQQLRRVKEGDRLEDSHMRGRQMVVRWIQANSKAIEQVERDGKRYLRVVDAAAFREAAGALLARVQEIKSTGDYASAKQLLDEHGTHVDSSLRDEVLARYATLDAPAYLAFVMPRLRPRRNTAGKIVDVEISYPLSLEQQMLEWSGRRHAAVATP